MNAGPVTLKSPKEKPSTQGHRMILAIADTRRKGWQLSDADLPNVPFEYGNHFVHQNIENDSLPNHDSMTMPMITTASHPGACPMEFSHLEMARSITMNVEVQRKMGFKS